MRKTPLFIAISASILLSACGSSGLFNRNRPDEFAVQRQAPLVVPPDFGLVPPSADAPRPAASAQDQAMDALFGGPAPRSDIEKTTLNRAGTPAPGIRSNVGDPGTATVAKGEVTRDILAAPEGDGREAQAVIPG
jgi:Protein of unknown function (DUF3035)